MSTPRTVSDLLVAAAQTATGITVLEHDGRVVELPYTALLEIGRAHV